MRLQTLLEARWILAILVVLAIVSSFLTLWLLLLFLLSIFCTLAFFRDPDRAAPPDPNLVVAAADGTIIDIVELDENEILKAKTRRVGIFLSIFDVHTNRSPFFNSSPIFAQATMRLAIAPVSWRTTIVTRRF